MRTKVDVDFLRRIVNGEINLKAGTLKLQIAVLSVKDDMVQLQLIVKYNNMVCATVEPVWLGENNFLTIMPSVPYTFSFST